MSLARSLRLGRGRMFVVVIEIVFVLVLVMWVGQAGREAFSS